MSERDKDRWRTREVERILFLELKTAAEDYRLANLHLREVAAPSATGAQFPDSHVEANQVLAACRRAHAAWSRALDRWGAFVRHGTVPDDIAT